MSTTRLLFLYPPFFRAPTLRINRCQLSRQRNSRLLLRQSQSQLQNRCLCIHSRTRAGTRTLNTDTGTSSSSFRQRQRWAQNGARSSQNIETGRVGGRAFSSTSRREERLLKRHGKAVEPFLVLEEEGEAGDVGTGKVALVEEREKERREEGDGKDVGVGEGGEKEGEKDVSKEPLPEEIHNAARLLGDADPGSGSGSANPGTEQAGTGQSEDTPPSTSANTNASTSTSTPANPLETVLHMPPPETAEEENASKPPHLQTPPYVHHFDTYTLVQRVETGGFSNEQAITSMKAVRGLLALNLEVARKGLVSKSDVENETYLFRAACSELKTEIQNTRKKDEEAMRRERTLLQHEVDILNQKLSQELLTLKDDLKGMFDDRKMSVRMEQRTMESKIQELNYKITVLLNSDSKSEIEGLRWVLTRRSVMGILFMAFMVLTSLRYASYKTHEDDLRAKKKDEVIKAEALGGGEMAAAQGVAEILAAN
ncbi:hypothetical protein IFR05_008578 [Cadophora sp. M221]|nr:hypothetical protein IFR05_008578 [Cadophora sp. M221]